MKVAPSLLACDFKKMGDEVIRLAENGADYIHLDVMDGNFVPNISFGPAVIKAIRPCTNVPFDVHLMIDNPKRYINDYLSAGADIITFHVEAEDDIDGTIKKIKNGGAKVGLSIKPNTPAKEVFDYLDKVFMILVMTVEPGFGGQAFMPDMMEKVKIIKAEAKRKNINVLIQVDGGINDKTAPIAAANGVDICVAGTGIFKAESMKDAINNIKKL